MADEPRDAEPTPEIADVDAEAIDDPTSLSDDEAPTPRRRPRRIGRRKRGKEAQSTSSASDDRTESDREPVGESVSRTAKQINKVLVAALAAAIVIIIQQWGGPSQAGVPNAAEMPDGHPDVSEMEGGAAGQAPAGGMSEFTEADPEKVAELEKKIEENPKDVAAMSELGSLQHSAGQWEESRKWQERILKIEPDNVDALLALGVIQFNTDQVDEAEKTWKRVSKLAPDQPHSYYNLGFVYLAREPVDNDALRAAWEKVIELDPDSDMAKTASDHLDRLEKKEH